MEENFVRIWKKQDTTCYGLCGESISVDRNDFVKGKRGLSKSCESSTVM